MQQPHIALNNGIKIPQLGFGTWKMHGVEAERAVDAALQIGYRHIDTARIYRNEKRVGRAIQASEVEREDIFVTTKIFNTQHNNPVKAIDDSLRRLNLDYIDLYLIHWPVKERLATWKTLEGEYKKGKVRAIGVSNFTVRHLQELLEQAEIPPAVNQVEFHPFLFQQELLLYCQQQKIALEAYSPLAHGRKLADERITKIAKQHNKTNAQIMIRWSLQLGNIVIPKSSHPERIEENFKVFDFKLSSKEMNTLNSMNEDFRTCWDPEQVR